MQAHDDAKQAGPPHPDITALLKDGDAPGLLREYGEAAGKAALHRHELHECEARTEALKQHVRINAARSIARGSNAEERRNIYEQHLSGVADESGEPLYPALLEERSVLSYRAEKSGVRAKVADRAITLLVAGCVGEGEEGGGETGGEDAKE